MPSFAENIFTRGSLTGFLTPSRAHSGRSECETMTWHQVTRLHLLARANQESSISEWTFHTQPLVSLCSFKDQKKGKIQPLSTHPFASQQKIVLKHFPKQQMQVGTCFETWKYICLKGFFYSLSGVIQDSSPEALRSPKRYEETLHAPPTHGLHQTGVR